MPKISFTCLREEVQIASVKYPILMTFVTAQNLLRIASVPKFEKEKSHKDIADSLRLKPLDEWQRPPDDDRVAQIAAVFSASDNPA